MKRRKSFSLSDKAIARGEQIAAETGKSLSAVIEEQLLAIPSAEAAARRVLARARAQDCQRPQ